MSLARRLPLHASFILPVYGAAGFLERTLATARNWLEARPESWELIVVDDGSTDGSSGILKRFVARERGRAVTVARFVEHHGKGLAVRAGLARARGRYVVFTDCDLAYPMENVGRILRRLESGADAAIACRVLPRSTYLIHPSFFSYLYTRHLLGRAFNALCRMLTVPRILDSQAGLKGFRGEAIRGVLGSLKLEGFSFDVELLRALLDRGASIEEVPVTFRYDSEPSTVRFVLDSAAMVRDLVLVRARSIAGWYRGRSRTSHPPGIVINADDYGLAPGVNHAIQEGLVAGWVDRTSILLGTPYAGDAIAWAARHPEHAYGVHLNLTLGAPVCAPESVPSLVDRRGRFHGLAGFVLRLLAGRIRHDDVRREWEAQIVAVASAGIVPGHLDSHQHVHLMPGILSAVALPLARRTRLSLRAMSGPVPRRFGVPDPKALLLAFVTRWGMRGARAPVGTLDGLGCAFLGRTTFPQLRAALARLRAGRAYELVVHPGSSAEARAHRETGDRYLRGRVDERRLLSSEEVRLLVDLRRWQRLATPTASSRRGLRVSTFPSST